MNILQLCQWDFAGCGYFLSEAINEHTEHHSRHIRIESDNLHYPFDIRAPTSQMMQVMYRWADVIHIHDAFAHIPKSGVAKPTVITYHGSKYRKNPEKHHIKCRQNSWIGTVATADLTQYGLAWMPDCRPDLSEYVNRARKPRIAQSPTKRKTKGTEQIVTGLLGRYDLDIIEMTPWEQCLKRRGKAHIIIDQFRAGYGCSAIEGWAMGQPVIAGGTPQVLKMIKRCVGYIPFYACAENAVEIRESVQDLLDNPDVYEQTVKMGVQCWNDFHSPQAVAKRAIGFYQQATDGYVGLRCQAINASDTAIVRYLGIPTQRQTFIANASGTHYSYDGNERDILIDARDVKQFVNAKRKNKRLFKLVRLN